MQRWFDLRGPETTDLLPGNLTEADINTPDPRGKDFIFVRNADADQQRLELNYELLGEDDDPAWEWAQAFDIDGAIVTVHDGRFGFTILPSKQVLQALAEAVRDLSAHRGGRRRDLLEFAELLEDDAKHMRESDDPEWALTVHPWVGATPFVEVEYVPHGDAARVAGAVLDDRLLELGDHGPYADRMPLSGDYPTALILVEALRVSPIGDQLAPLRSSLEQWKTTADAHAVWPA